MGHMLQYILAGVHYMEHGLWECSNDRSGADLLGSHMILEPPPVDSFVCLEYWATRP